MKILLLGKNGQVGWELQRSLAPLGELVALDADSTDFCGDFTDPAGLAQTIHVVQPNVIVNAAAYTAVDQAEGQPDIAHAINTYAPGVLAEVSHKLGILLVHYSTDYVFDGSGNTPWRESDCTGPLSVYGRTKLEGEQRIAATACRHLIFRTSWVYGARGSNFAKTILRLAGERETLDVIDDQIGAPTGAEFLADVTAHAIRMSYNRTDISGTFHCAAAGETSWYEYAQFVVARARASGHPLKLKTVNAISSAAYRSAAHRPLNSRLNTHHFSETFDLQVHPWQNGVARLIDELLG
ncbi:MAG: dTDP-4-dehydrorhamnose reductase [Rhodocyclales bacterium]|nr:dTDP-4-dehydrorhamnose reductase [Rhodocyclales bacterium]